LPAHATPPIIPPMKLLRRRIYVAVFVAVVLAVSFAWGLVLKAKEPRLGADEVRAFAGATGEPEEQERPFRHWRVVLGDGGEAAVFTSADAAYEPTGYGGPINVLVLLASDGTVEKVKLLEHMETPSYMRGVDAFLEKFRGVPASAPLTVGEDIDAMTRATVSSKAIAEAVRLSARRAAAEIYGLEVPTEEKRVAVDWPWALAALGFFALAFVGRRVAVDKLRLLTLAAAVGLLGFWGGRFVAVGDVGRFTLFTLPPLLPRLSLYLLIIGGAVAALVWGNLYCGWVCPFGALSELLHKIPVPKLTVNSAFVRRASRLRVVILAAILGVIVGTRALDAGGYEPFDQAFAWVGGTLAFVFLALVLAASVVHYRFFCRYLCAIGGMFGEVTAAGRRVPAPPACEGCHECVKVCDMNAIYGERETYVARHICIECGKCSAVCPSGIGPGSD
jgi:NosR/NirI family nitrous oxide reductase transcriptional regulator